MPALGGLVLATAVPGCARVSRGEFSPTACTDEVDNDGDGATDCEDPDCRGLKVCAPKIEMAVDQTPIDPPLLPEPDIASFFGDAATPEPEGDAAVGPTEDDAGADPDPDPDFDPPDSCVPNPCEPDETCAAGKCTPVVDPGPGTNTVSVFVTAADIRTLRDPDRNCLEPTCGRFLCGCEALPDPYALVRLNDSEIGRTSTRMDELSPTWDEAAIPVEYRPGDRLEVVLFDEDHEDVMFDEAIIDDAEDDIMFVCVLDPPSDGTLVFSCAGPSGSQGTSTLNILMSVL